MLSDRLHQNACLLFIAWKYESKHWNDTIKIQGFPQVVSAVGSTTKEFETIGFYLLGRATLNP